MAKAARKITPRSKRKATARRQTDQREAAALEFEPIAGFRELVEAIDRDLLLSVGQTARMSVAMLGLTKPQMVELATTSGCEDWFDLLEKMGHAREILTGIGEHLKQVEARCLVAAASIG